MKMLEEIRFAYRKLAVFGIMFSAAVLPLCLCATELSERDWERIDLDGDHTSIEAADKSRRNSAIPTDTAGDLVVPSALRGYKVVSIGNQAFYNCSKLTSVTIPEGVTNIADQAFYGCSSLTNVVFPSTLKSIGSHTFVGCSQFLSVNIEVPRLTIGDRAFRDCDSLRLLRFKGDELVVKDRAFFGCGGLLDVELFVKDVNLAEGAFSGGTDESYGRGYCVHLTNAVIAASNRVELGDRAFRNCDELQIVRINGESLVIGTRAFFGCGGLQEVNLKAQLVTLAEGVFSGGTDTDYVNYGYCDRLASAVLSASGASTFGDSVFSSCGGLQTVELPVGLVSVPQNAFSYCTSLQSIALSSNVTSIAYRAFDTCTSLKVVELSEGLRTIDAQAFYGCESLPVLKIPQSVSSIGNRAFEACDGLGEVVFAGVDTNLYAAAEIGIGERCFYQDFTLSNVVFSAPSRIKAFGARTFSGCESLVRVSLPTDLVEIAESLFESCTALVDVPLPVTLKTIGNTAFNGCASLADFLIPTNNAVAIGNKAFANTRFWKEWPDDSLVENNGYILGFKGNPTSVVLPVNCRTIPNGMFEGMTTLTNVVVPAGLETVGSWAFAGSGIRWMDFSRSKLKTLGVSAFEGCSDLDSCLLSDSLTAIPDDAFRNCASLSSMDIPKSVASVGNSAFRDCSALSVMSGGDGVRTVGDYAFAGCVSLLPFRFPRDVAYGEHVFQGVRWTENVLFPSVGTMAQEYPQTYADIRSVVVSSTLAGVVDRACAGCVSLESIALPDGVSDIGVSAFEGCGALKSVTLPASVSNVGSNAFKGCSSIISLTTPGDLVIREVFPDAYATLRDIRLAGSVTSLCDNMFAGCASITAFDLPAALTEIGSAAFSGCSGLTSLVMPAGLGSIGDSAFKDCANLKTVSFMGGKPSANPNIYAGTPRELVSLVRPSQREAWLNPMLPQHWPEKRSDGLEDYKEYLEHSRRINWWRDPDAGDDGDVDFGDDDDFDDQQDWDDDAYDASVSHVYDGYLLDGGVVVGKVQVKAGAGRHDQADDETDVGMTATVVLLGEGATVSLKGSAEGVDEFGGSGELVSTKRKDGREMSVMFDADGMFGDFDGFDIVGARNVFGKRTSADKRAALAAMDICGGTRSVILRTDGDSPFASGYAVLTVAVSSGGKAKVSGVLPDGTKVSVASQLMVFEDHCELPVVAPLYSGKRGGLGFAVVYPQAEGADAAAPFVDGLSDWVADPGKATGFAAQLTEVGVGTAEQLPGRTPFSVTERFAADGADIDDSLLPVGVEVTPDGSKWRLPKADKVKFIRDEGRYEIQSDYGNPAGLKLSYSAKTGTFTGSFKVYAVTEAGAAKSFTASVTGAVLDGKGLGTAVIKTIGSVPVTIERRRTEETVQ